MEDNGMKFDMFEGVPEFDFNKLENGEESELVSVTLKSDTKRNIPHQFVHVLKKNMKPSLRVFITKRSIMQMVLRMKFVLQY
ncbi:UNVERIFIED_ORG: hypothetical protein [Escherichia phage CMSTMSU]